MLLSEPTKYGSGITIWGDYQDFENLHETIHFLAEGVPLTINFQDFMLGLAYDIRHAFQGDRKTKISRFDRLDRVKYYGVDILWPVFLVQLGLMRWSAGFHATTREHQANLLF